MIEDFFLRSPACKMAAAGVLLSFIFLFSDIAAAQTQNGQWCYVCHVTPFSNDCMSNPGSLHDSRLEVQSIRDMGDNTTDPKTVSNVGFCPPSMPYCTIEEIVVDNDVKLFYRDCSDGKRFSVAINGSRLDDPQPDNITHCGFLLQFMGQVCVTLCSGEFCNGPNNAGTTLGTHWSPMYLLLVVYVLSKYAL